MEGLVQATSGQAKPLDSSNKHAVEKLKSVKPPLLPKPHGISHQRALVTDRIPQRLIHEPGSPGFTAGRLQTKDVADTLPIKKCEKLSPKPPILSIKPQIPPKSFALNSLRSDIALQKTISSQRLDSNQKESPLSEASSIMTHQKNLQKSGIVGKDVAMHEGLPKHLILSLQKNSGLAVGEENWSVKDLLSDSKQLSELRKQVENCSKHSHILKGEVSPRLPDKMWNMVSSDADELHSPSHNIGAKDNGGICPGAVESMIYLDCNKDGDFNNVTTTYINGYENEDLANTLLQDQNMSSNFQLKPNINFDVPKSFLHRYVSILNQAKEPEKCDEKLPEGNQSAHSFVHKNKEQMIPRLGKGSSPEQQDANCSNNSWECSVKNSVPSGDHPGQHLPKKSDTSDMNSFSKRFPWFGSFGKGSKKDGNKKERCFSQFYASSTVPDDPSTLRGKSRTKSLPDIKQSRIVPDGCLELKNEEAENSRNARISGEYPHSDSDDDNDSLNHVGSTADKDYSTMAYLKAKELMTSEEVFIDVLKLLNVDFRNYIQSRNLDNKSSCIPNAEVDKILNHLSQLQSLNEDILEDLRKRIENWESNPKIADVIVKKGAFLKMYTTYIQNFECQTNYLDECVAKYPKFGKIVREFEATERCKKLSLKHYMLKPVQRIPQYRLLLNDYLKYLEETSEDYQDTLSALKIVCEVVDHANRNVSHGDREGRLMHFQSLLSDFELIKPGRQLVKDGTLEKICRKTVRDRYFILLNDCLLHTTYSKQYLKIHQQLPLSGMKICYNDDERSPSFTVHSITKSFILCAKSGKECREWVETLQGTIEEHVKKQKTFLNVKIEEDTSFKLGKEAPVWVQDSKVTMCQICTAEFTALFRRHHCRGCGKVVCRNCGSNQAPLQYRNFKPDRVCDHCFELLLKDYEDSESNICESLKEMLNLNDEASQNEYLSIKAKFIKYTAASNWRKQKYIPPRLKEVSANDSQSVISGWLYRKSRKSWKPFWYVLKDHVLYVYKASEDVLALETIPVLGYEVERASENHEDVDKKLVFSLVHPRQAPITFRAESYAASERWFDALSAATNFDYLTL